MGTSRNGRCETQTGPSCWPGVSSLQWGPPGMGGVSSQDAEWAAWSAHFNGDLPEWEV